MKRKHSLFWVKAGVVFIGAALAAFISTLLGEGAVVATGDPRHFAPVFGVALGVVLVGGGRYLPALFLGTLFPFLFAADDGYALLSLPVAVTVSALLGSRILRSLGAGVAMESIRDALWIIFYGMILSTLAGAAVETLFICYGDSGSWADFKPLLLANWLAAVVGSVVVAPFVLTWVSRTSFEFRTSQIFETLLWFLTLIGFGFITFQNWAPSDVLLYPMELAIFPIMAWAAIRFGTRGTSAGILVLALLAVSEVASASGSLGLSGGEGAPSVWIFIGIIAVTSVCLASVMAELRHRENQISENESRLRAFTEALPDVAFVITGAGEIEDVFAANPQIEANHRLVNTGEVRGRNLSDLFDEPICFLFGQTIDAALAGRAVESVEYSLRSLDGNERWFQARVSPMSHRTHQSERVVWVAYDITSRKQFEAGIRKRDTILSATARANNYLLTRRGIRTAAESAIGEIAGAIGADRGYYVDIVGAPGAQRHGLKGRFEWRRFDDAPSVLNDGFLKDVIFEDRFPGWYARLSEGWTIQLSGADCTLRELDILNALESQSLLLVPLRSADALSGFFALDFFDTAHRWSESEVNAVRVLASGLSGLILIQEREDELRIARDQANAASYAKGEFLAVMSHEIRTPMNAIIGYTDLLVHSKLNAGQLEHAGIIKRSGNALLALINSILDYSKIEARTLELEAEPLEIEQIVCEALESILPAAKAKGLHVDYTVAPSVAGSYLGDRHRLCQILINLVGNAVKFTESGSIQVEVQPLVDESDAVKDALCFRVVDTGCGIPADKFETLFTPFTQVDSARTRRHGGTGLGLAISKRLVEQMDGRIWVDSEIGTGSRFQFVVHLARAGSALPAEPQSAAAKELAGNTHLFKPDFAEMHPLSILLCDDDPDNRCVIREILENLGYTPATAENEDGCTRLAKEQHFDVFLLDVRLPDRSGIEVTRAIRSGQLPPVDPAQYIIAITAFAMNADREKCLAAGMNDYLSKPIDISRLKKALIKAHAHLHEGQI